MLTITNKCSVLLNNKITTAKVVLSGNTEIDMLFSEESFDTLLAMRDLSDFYSYNDISAIHCNGYSGNYQTLTNLPNNLTKLVLENSLIRHVDLTGCKSLTVLAIIRCNLTQMPDGLMDTQLKTLTIEKTGISNFDNYEYPKTLTVVNLNNNMISTHQNYTVFPDYTVVYLKNNYIVSDKNTVTEGNRTIFLKPSLPVTTNMIFQEITDYDINYYLAQRIIRPFVHDERQVMNVGAMIQTPIPVVARLNPLEQNSQTVHISSICKNVSDTIKRIKEETKDLYDSSKEDTYINEFKSRAYTYSFLYFFHLPKNILAKQALNNNLSLTDIHTLHKITYKE